MAYSIPDAPVPCLAQGSAFPIGQSYETPRTCTLGLTRDADDLGGKYSFSYMINAIRSWVWCERSDKPGKLGMETFMQCWVRIQIY